MNPLIEQLKRTQEEMNLSDRMFKLRSGVDGSTLNRWKKGNVPRGHTVRKVGKNLKWKLHTIEKLERWANEERENKNRKEDYSMLVTRLIERIEKLNMSQKEAGKELYIDSQYITGWKAGRLTPTDDQATQIKRFLERTEDIKDEPTTVSKLPPRPRIVLKGKLMNLIQEIERKWGRLTLCPDDDPMMVNLRSEVGYYDNVDVSGHYDKGKVETLREKRNIHGRDIGLAIGKGRNWYITWLRRLRFTRRELEDLAELFEVDVEYFRTVDE